MKVLLVYCNSMLENALPISISQLSSCLKEAGIEVSLFDTTFYKWGHKSAMENRIEGLQFKPCPIRYIEGDVYADFLKKIETFRPDIIGMSVVEPTFNFGMKLLMSAKEIIRHNGIKVAVGGVHAVLAPETVSVYDNIVDYICISEGERAFVELCRKIERGESVDRETGFWVRKGTKWLKNDRAPLIDLDTLPNLDFSIFDPEYLNKPIMGKMFRTVSLETSRGCLYCCSYCGSQSLTKLFKSHGRWFRQKSIDKVMKEFEHHAKKYNPEFLYIISDSFLTNDYEWIKMFSDSYKKFSIPFWFDTRPENVSADKLRLVKEVGCMRVSVGIESGNEKFRKKVLHRHVSNERMLQAGKILKEFDISFSVNIIIGFPNETREMIFDSIELCRQINPDSVSTHIFNPYHGSELREVSIREGYIKPDLIADDFFQGYLLKGSALSSEQIMGLFRTIPLYVKFPKKEYGRIRVAEKFDDEGNKAFALLKDEYYKEMWWA